MVHVVRDADVRRVAEISAELHAVKSQPAITGTGRLLSTAAPIAGRIPGLYRGDVRRWPPRHRPSAMGRAWSA